MDKKGRPFPKIVVEQWNREKNGPMENYCLGSHSKVFWRCTNGKCGHVHKWITTINSRTNKKKSIGCPYCSIHPKVCPCFCNSSCSLINSHKTSP
jgi:hypothetical protein